VDLLIREVEDLVDHLLLRLLDHPGVLGRGHDVADVLFGVGDDAGRGRLDSEEACERVGRRLEEPDERVGGHVDGLDRKCDPESGGFVLGQSDGLGDELAERHVEVRDEREGENERQRRGDDRIEEVLDQRLADGAERDRERGDAELDRADEAHGVVHDPECHPRPAVACVSELHQPRPSRRDERVLGRDEKGVPRHEQENGDDLEKNGHAPIPGALVLGGISSNSSV
jgi:hypothetical protein